MPLFKLFKARPKGKGRLFWKPELNKIKQESTLAKQKVENETSQIKKKLKKRSEDKKIEQELSKSYTRRNALIKLIERITKKPIDKTSIKDLNKTTTKLKRKLSTLSKSNPNYKLENQLILDQIEIITTKIGWRRKLAKINKK
jgi:hypothetical protein